MYLHMGSGYSVNEKNIIAILNIDYVKNTKDNQKFYDKLLEENEVVDISNGNEKALILTSKKEKIKAYISNISANTISKRKL